MNDSMKTDDWWADLMGAEDAGQEVPAEAGISELVDAYQAARDRKDALEAELKEAKAALDAAKGALTEAMVLDETDSIGRNGKRYSLVGKVKYSKRSGADQELFEMLRENGLESLITETVNANTLSAAMRSIAEEAGGALPEEWDGCINTYEYTDISVRKA